MKIILLAAAAAILALHYAISSVQYIREAYSARGQAEVSQDDTDGY